MWDPPDNSTDVTGYIIDYGTVSGAYTQRINVGNTNSFTVGNLTDGQTYYFAAVSYNSAMTQSEHSNEVSGTMGITQFPLVILKSGTGTGEVSGGAISCGSACNALYKPSTVVSLSARADTGATFAGWSGGGCSGTGFCTTTINEATTITATLNKSIATYVITATVSGQGGTISPSGTSSMNYGESQSFTITPNAGFSIASVTVDGKLLGALANYTFSEVADNHTITASFKKVSSTTTRGKTRK